MDVDHAVRVGRAELVRDDLHVARQHDEVDLLFFEERELLVLDRALRVLRHLEYGVGHGEVFRDVPQIFVVRHDLHDLDARQLAGVVPEEQFPEAVGVLAHEDGNSLRLGPAHLARHAEAAGDLLDAALEAHAVRVQFRGVEDDALIEDARFLVRMLL